MKTQIRPLIILFALLTFITGVVYPLIVTGIAQLAFPSQANGSLITENNQQVGSRLIGQNFTANKYFWSRPSATSVNPYNAYDLQTLTGSSGSNLGPLSKDLVDNVQARADALRSATQGYKLLIPVDLVTASGSGLDPHISVSAAYYQIPRVALARSLTETVVAQLVDRYTETRQFGVLGEPRVNVLMLNLALDGLQ